MRLLMPVYQKIKVNRCVKTIPISTAAEAISQWKGLESGAGASIYGLAAGLSKPGKDRAYRTRNIILDPGDCGLGCIVAEGVIHSEAQQQKVPACQDENTSVLTADSRTVPSFKEPKAEVRWVQCKEEDRYIDELFEHKLNVQRQWGAK